MLRWWRQRRRLISISILKLGATHPPATSAEIHGKQGNIICRMIRREMRSSWKLRGVPSDNAETIISMATDANKYLWNQSLGFNRRSASRPETKGARLVRDRDQVLPLIVLSRVATIGKYGVGEGRREEGGGRSRVNRHKVGWSSQSSQQPSGSHLLNRHRASPKRWVAHHLNLVRG